MITLRSTNAKAALGFLIGVFLLFAAHAGAEQQGTVLTNASVGQPSNPDRPDIKIYKYTNKAGVRSYSDRAPMGIRYEVMRFDCFACNPVSTVDWNTIPLQLKAYQYAINSASKRYQVDPALVRAVIHAESAFRPSVKSNKGAAGLMQLMPGTAKDMGVINVMVPEENIQGGVKYLAWLLEENRGNTMLATAAYNAGPGAVKRFNGIPPYEETQVYVERVKILHDRYKKALGKTFSGSSITTADS